MKQTIANKLTNILKSVLPMVRDTGLMKDLGTVHPDPKSKGKAIKFTWRYGTFRLTENMKVYEFNFMGKPEATPEAVQTEEMIKNAVKA